MMHDQKNIRLRDRGPIVGGSKRLSSSAKSSD